MAKQPEFKDSGKPHPYHIVDPSPWPLAGAFAGGLFALGTVMYMHDMKIGEFEVGLSGVYLGLAAIVAVMFFWWRDVVKEAVVEKAHTKIVEFGMRYGMALFIASEVMFFVAFFWAFFDASLYADQAIMYLRTEYTGGQWPPAGIEVVPAFGLPFMMTMILLLSGCAVTWAHHAIQEGHNRDVIRALAATVFLGVFFLGFQVYEYTAVQFDFTGGIYPSTFFMATGFHGFHVLIGTIFLFVCLLRAMAHHFTPEGHFGFEAAAWYWHFVDVVWLFLFVAVYWWGGA
mgnify:CR=1 FL=1